MLALTTALLLAGTLAPAPAPTSQPVAESNQADADERARVSASEYIFIDGENLEGDVLKPEGAPVRGRLGAKHKSLIKLRGTFTDYMIRLSRDI